MTLDFLMEFRFEYMWPCWLLLRTVNDSFKYQGIAFAIFFTLIAFTSDLICYLLVPATWIFLFGSTCVWIELVWHAERGICAPTVALCFLFLYVEVAVRLRDPKSIPLSIDLCRPFAAHSIGYPVVTLGFGLKSLLTHQFRIRKQRQVQAQNVKYFYILESALPLEAHSRYRSNELANGELPSSGTPALLSANHNSLSSGPVGEREREKERSPKDRAARRHLVNGKLEASVALASNTSTSDPVGARPVALVTTASTATTTTTAAASQLQYSSSRYLHASSLSEANFFTHHPESPVEESKAFHLSAPSSASSLSSAPPSPCLSDRESPPCPRSQARTGVYTSAPTTTTTTSKGQRISEASATALSRDEAASKLDDELRRLRSELQSLRISETELRTRVSQLTAAERSSRNESSQARQEAESATIKLASANQRLQTERSNTQAAEKRLSEERRQRLFLEQQLASAEKRARKDVEEKETLKTTQAPRSGGKNASSQRSMPAVNRISIATNTNSSPTDDPCTSEHCARRLGDLEAQIRSLTHEITAKEAQFVVLRSSQQRITPQTNPQGHQRFAELSDKLAELQSENNRLTATLRDEDKMKQKLLTAYHTSLKEINELNDKVNQKDSQLVELNLRLDYLMPHLCDYVNLMDASTKCTASALDGDHLSRGGPHFQPPLRSEGDASGLLHLNGGRLSSLQAASFDCHGCTSSNEAARIDSIFAFSDFENTTWSASCPHPTLYPADYNGDTFSRALSDTRDPQTEAHFRCHSFLGLARAQEQEEEASSSSALAAASSPPHLLYSQRFLQVMPGAASPQPTLPTTPHSPYYPPASQPAFAQESEDLSASLYLSHLRAAGMPVSLLSGLNSAAYCLSSAPPSCQMRLTPTPTPTTTAAASARTQPGHYQERSEAEGKADESEPGAIT